MTDGSIGEGASSSMSHGNSENLMAARSDHAVVQEPPDRRKFERYLSRLNNDIKAKEQDLKNLLGHRTSATSAASASYIPGEINKAKEQSKRCRKDREQYRLESAKFQSRQDELKKVLAVKRQEISTVEENYLHYKNEQKLVEQLQRWQMLYDNKQFTNIREETAIVHQIDKLRRNQKHLKKWRTMCEERDRLESELKLCRNQMQIYHAKIRESRRIEEQYKATYKEGVQNVAAKKKELDEFYTQKRRLIQDYSEKRQIYIDYRRSRPADLVTSANADMRAATLVGTRRHVTKLKRKASGGVFGGSYGYGQQAANRCGAGDDSDSDSDGCTDFELFFEEKRNCRSLISYLQRVAQPAALCLTPSSGSYESESQMHHASLSNASSLAEDQHLASDLFVDDAGENLVLLKKDSGDEAALSSAGLSDSHAARRRVSKKDKTRKPHQAMSYDPQTLSRFDLIGVDAPLTVSEVPAAIDSLKEKLRYYEDQTRLPPDTSSNNYWFDTFGIPLHADRMISSESEMTTDSARFSLMTPSDADDSLSATGLVSPDYAGMATVTSPPFAGSLSFTISRGEEASAVTTPLAAVAKEKMEVISEHVVVASKDTNDGEGLSRIPTFDEGIADLAMDIRSKDSSAGDSTSERAKEEAAELRKKFEQLKLEKK